MLDLCARLFLSPGDTLVNFPPSFGVYSFLGHIYDANIVHVERGEDFSLDIERAERELAGAKLAFVASPNNPTGNSLSREELKRLLAPGAVIAVDEAYAEFAGETFADLVEDHDNLIVLRTFSKWAGLAGMRAGFAIVPEALAEVIWRVKIPYNLTVAAEQAILASLQDVPGLRANVDLIKAERERLYEKLAALPWLRPFPSSANFILFEVKGIAAKDVRAQLRQRGILVRYFDSPGLRNCIRVSVGRPRDSERFIEALTEIGAGIRMMDHMLEQLAKHGLFDITVDASGDIERDPHHLVEDLGLVLGQALNQALGERRGITRFGHAVVPMDESLVLVALDLGGRPYAGIDLKFERDLLGQLPTENVSHFLEAFAQEGRLNVHVRELCGGNDHHRAEAAFKALARALAAAVRIDERIAGEVPSTKDVL